MASLCPNRFLKIRIESIVLFRVNSVVCRKNTVEADNIQHQKSHYRDAVLGAVVPCHCSNNDVLRGKATTRGARYWDL